MSEEKPYHEKYDSYLCQVYITYLIGRKPYKTP